MSLTDSFITALNNKDITKIRAAVTNSFTADPSLSYFKELMDAVNRSGIDIFEPHNDDELKYNKQDWTKEYLTNQLTEIQFNFSKERLDLLKQMTKYIYPDKKQTKPSAPAPRTTAAPRRRNVTYRRSQNNISKPLIIAVVVIIVLIIIYLLS